MSSDIEYLLDYLKFVSPLTITLEKRKYGKKVTIIEGFDKKDNIKEIARLLKKTLACGGTVKEKRIELQGNHIDRAKIILEKEGYHVQTS